METDIETQNHAYIIARQYNFANVESLKTERVTTPGSPVNSVWLAKGDGSIRSFAQYNQDWLIGKPCDDCWGESKVFGERVTPKIVTVLLQNIQACPDYGPAPDGSFVKFVDGQVLIFPLIQDIDFPRHFSRQIPDWLDSESLNIHWYARKMFDSELFIDLQPSGSVYFQRSSALCTVYFENSLTECDAPAVVGYGGTGRIIF